MKRPLILLFCSLLSLLIFADIASTQPPPAEYDGVLPESPKLAPLVNQNQYCPATIVYVNAAVAGGAQNGSSWANAFPTLQDALVAPAPCSKEIWVAAGIYYPDEGGGQTDNDRQATFQLANNVAIYGGFVGTENNRNQRDLFANITVLSGDIDQNDGVDSDGVVTDTAQIAGINSYTVVDGSNTNATAILDGVTITAGWANGNGAFPDPNRRGAGIYITNGTPSLTHVSIVGNKATGGGLGFGGGVYWSNGDGGEWLNVRIAGNSASQSGGGMYTSNSDLTLNNLLLTGNHANFGGGIYNNSGSNVGFNNATIVKNFATDTGGAVRNNNSTHTTIYNTIFWLNDDVASSGANRTIASDFASTNIISYTLLADGCPSDTICGGNMYTFNPMFVEPITNTVVPTTLGNFQTERESPAIEAGLDALVPAGLTTDFAGKDRIYGMDELPANDVDLGAYEHRLPDLIVVPSLNANGTDLDLSWTNEAEACVWSIFRDDTPYFTPDFDDNFIGYECDSLQCFSATHTIAGIIADTSQNDFLRVLPEECQNVFSSNEVGVFHFALEPGSS
jgi:hypothetical protein